jgi:hypothetical protein
VQKLVELEMTARASKERFHRAAHEGHELRKIDLISCLCELHVLRGELFVSELCVFAALREIFRILCFSTPLSSSRF